MKSTVPSSVSMATVLRYLLAATATLSVAVQSYEWNVDHQKIVGGDAAVPGDYPYFVDMGGCGGALVAPDIVLFAAHCEDDTLNRQVNIGAYEPKSDAEGAQPRFCDEWIADPDYTENPTDSDFALCKLDAPVDLHKNLNATQKPVFLELNPTATVPAVGEDLLVMGLGRLESGGAAAASLQDVVVPVVSNDECNRPDRYDGLITDTMLCAGFPIAGGYDACQGDSGGPIVRRTSRPDGTIVDVHVGVVSWGAGCAAPNYPGVYARTSARYDWIVSTMCDDLNSVSDLCENDDSSSSSNNNNGVVSYDDPEEFVCENGEQALAVTVGTDKWPEETAWLLTDDQDRWIELRKYLVKYNEYTSRLCLRPQTCYTWEIRDDYGDGMCTPEGDPCGSYSLALENQGVIHTGDGSFRQSDTKTFCTDGTLPPRGPDNDNESSSSSSEDEETSAPILTPPVWSFCGLDRGHLEFRVDVETDDHGPDTAIAMYNMLPDFSDLGELIFVEAGLPSNGAFTYPSGGDYLCLEENECYLFAITDAIGEGAALAGSYTGYLGDAEVFSGDGDFGDYDDRMFCTGEAVLPNPVVFDNAPNDNDPNESSAPTEAPTTVFPTQVPTTDLPTQVPTTGLPTQVPTTDLPTQVPTTLAPTATPTGSPTATPTGSPTAAPTPVPTAEPTPVPTGSPTRLPTTNPTVPTTPQPVCVDDASFRFKNKSRWTCKRYIKGKNQTKLRKRCNKWWKDKRIKDWCPHRCGKKAGVGPCDHLATGGSTKRRQDRNKKRQELLTSSDTSNDGSLVQLAEHKTEEKRVYSNTSNSDNDNIFTATITHGGNQNDSWLNFKNREERGQY